MKQRSSIILFEQSYENNSKRNELAVILFQNKKWNTFMEPGGRKKNGTLIETAIHELGEETLNSINIMSNTLESCFSFDHRDIKTGQYSRVYLIGIKPNQYNETTYRYNKNLLDKRQVPVAWKETDKVGRFYVSDLTRCIDMMADNSDNFECLNVNGEPCNIYYRTLEMIRSVIKENWFPSTNHDGSVSITQSNNKKFLIGTQTMEICTL
jgi:hypothetical protein